MCISLVILTYIPLKLISNTIYLKKEDLRKKI